MLVPTNDARSVAIPIILRWLVSCDDCRVSVFIQTREKERDETITKTKQKLISNIGIGKCIKSEKKIYSIRITYRCVECTPACWSRDTNFGVRKGVSTYSFASRSVSGLGAASVTGDICVSKCWLLFDWVDNVDDVSDEIMGNAEPGGGGLRLEKLDDVSGTVIGSVVVWNLREKKRKRENRCWNTRTKITRFRFGSLS